MDIVKRYIYEEILHMKNSPSRAPKTSLESENWIQWVAMISPATCTYCMERHGHIFAVGDPNLILPQVHDHCNCHVQNLSAFVAGTVTERGKGGVDLYLFLYHSLPDNYLTKAEAKMQGWSAIRGNLAVVLPGIMIGGNIYKNNDGRLPSRPWRVWYEADFDYHGGYRNGKRVLFSSDGLIFVTFDHYLSFSEIVWEGI